MFAPCLWNPLLTSVWISGNITLVCLLVSVACICWFQEAVVALNSLQSNAEAIRKSMQHRNESRKHNIPNMVNYLQRAGLSVSSINPSMTTCDSSQLVECYRPSCLFWLFHVSRKNAVWSFHWWKWLLDCASRTEGPVFWKMHTCW